jgi:hypothetical protein
MNETTPCLWFDTEGEEAANLYRTVLPKLLTDPDREKSPRLMAATLKMKKIEMAPACSRSRPCRWRRDAKGWGQTLAVRGVTPTAGVRRLPFET